jgi:hypothetical protein
MIYEVGKEYTHDGSLRICISGFHFCLTQAAVYGHYSGKNVTVCEVEALGVVKCRDDKCVTDHIRIGRIIQKPIPGNTGDWNTGNRNTGNWNTGYQNTGDRNTGDQNTGNLNTGNWNTGDQNTGNRNTGNWNTGDQNTGNRNTGNRNTGDRNTGYWNTGDRNTGDWNTGNRNTGDWNTGNRNTGNWNTGDRNTGYQNTGDHNTGNWNTGYFCVNDGPLFSFDAPVKGMTRSEYLDLPGVKLINRIPVKTTEWVQPDVITQKLLDEHPEIACFGAYLRVVDNPGVPHWAEWWDGLIENERADVKAIPNFDAKKWKTITGIEV